MGEGFRVFLGDRAMVRQRGRVGQKLGGKGKVRRLSQRSIFARRHKVIGFD